MNGNVNKIPKTTRRRTTHIRAFVESKQRIQALILRHAKGGKPELTCAEIIEDALTHRYGASKAARA